MYEGIESIYELLENKRLKEALVQLEAISKQTNNWELCNQIEELHKTYGYMLLYAQQDIKDPNRKEMHDKIVGTAYELTDWTNIALSTTKSNFVYYQHIRTNNQYPLPSYIELGKDLETYTEDISTAPVFYPDKERQKAEIQKICQHRETALNKLFNKTWTSLRWKESDLEEVQHIIDSPMIGSNDKSVLISAIMMSLTHIFDKKKMQLLLKSCTHEDVQISQRAIVGTIIMADRYKKRIQYYPTLVNQLSILNENNVFCQDLFNIQLQFIMAQETGNIVQKMYKDIIPNILKAAQTNKGKNTPEENKEEDDLNPEWTRRMIESGLEKKMQELGNLQSEGADIHMSTFSTLKNVPFFNQVSHWFYPFDEHQIDILPIIQELGNNNISILDIMLNTDTLCNSDKYSFCFTLSNISKDSKNLVFKQMEEQMEIKEEREEILQEIVKRSQSRKNISRQYIQDLYRFAKIWIKRYPNQEPDFFSAGIQIWKNPYLNAYLMETEPLKELTDYLFYKKHYSESFLLYQELNKRMNDNAEIHQKIGFIFQKRKLFNNAIKEYQRAELLLPDNIWTLMHMAQCYKLDLNYESALMYYKKVEKMKPNDLNITQQIGECLMGLERYEEALTYLYKIEYLSKNPIQARRAIAWSSLCIGKYDDAIKYYQLLVQESLPTAQDWLNAGHTYLVKGDLKQALEQYHKAHNLCEDHTAFIELFNLDKQQLISSGITEEDIYILLDLLT